MFLSLSGGYFGQGARQIFLVIKYESKNMNLYYITGFFFIEFTSRGAKERPFVPIH
jgi:hypothetical protein